MVQRYLLDNKQDMLETCLDKQSVVSFANIQMLRKWISLEVGKRMPVNTKNLVCLLLYYAYKLHLWTSDSLVLNFGFISRSRTRKRNEYPGPQLRSQTKRILMATILSVVHWFSFFFFFFKICANFFVSNEENRRNALYDKLQEVCVIFELGAGRKKLIFCAKNKSEFSIYEITSCKFHYVHKYSWYGKLIPI